MAEYRRQIAAGGIAAVILAISIGIAVVFAPSLSGLSDSSTSSISALSSITSTSSPSPVTIYLNKTTTTTANSASNAETKSSHSQTVTVTTTVYRNGTTIYRNQTTVINKGTTIFRNDTTTVFVNGTTTMIETVTSTPTSNTTTTGSSSACPAYQGTGTPSYCVPIMISNSKVAPVLAGTQIMLRADWASFASHLASNVGNVVFADSTGAPLYAWCESSCANTQSVSKIWIKDDAQIPPSGVQGIYMYIFPTSKIQYSATGYWGAFPTITGTYGQYDNGPLVFDFYNNFNGTSLCACLTAVPFLGGLFTGGSSSYSVGNALTITATGSASSGAGYGYHVYLNTPESFMAIDSNVVATDLPSTVSSEAAYRYNAMDLVPPATSYLDNGFYSSYSALDFLCGCGNTLSIHLDQGAGENGSTVTGGTFQPWVGVQSFVWPATGSQYVNNMELQQLHGTDSTLSLAPVYADIAFVNGLPVQYYMTFHWMRTRNAPPNNMMPAASFDAISVYS